MSHDLNIWLRAGRGDVAPALFADPGQGRGWLVNAALNEAEPEDIPPEVAAQLRGATLLAQLHVQPSGRAGVAFARKLARRLAQDHGGAVEDPQTGVIWVPKAHRLDTALKAASSGRDPRRMALLSFGWRFSHDALSDAAGFAGFLDQLDAILPEAMPRRYGSYEPPQFRRDRDGLAPYIAGVLEPGAFFFSYTTPPAYGLGTQLAGAPGWERLLNGQECFKSRQIGFEIDAASLSAPGQMAHLKSVFLSLSALIRPFYAEVRPLHGFIPMRGTYGCDGRTEDHPIRGNFWRGIPAAPALARLVAAPYDGAGTEGWDRRAGQRFRIQEDWQAPPRIGWDGPQDQGRLMAGWKA